jgi:predicted Fe-S protein YdhL (DUF1289 family)
MKGYGVKDFARGCMRTYKEILAIVTEINAIDNSMA